jgi:hypothetical protein
MSTTNNKRAIYTPKTEAVDTQLDLIAKELAYNYYTNSFGDADVENNVKNTAALSVFKKEISGKIKVDLENNIRVRNIMIIGAGASHDSFKAMPLGKDLTNEMDEEYIQKIKGLHFLDEKYKEEQEAVKLTTGSNDINFENYLYILSKLFLSQPELRKNIKEITGIRYAPSLFNEIVAHMLKHSFLDIVINYNFEETLDQAIEDEIGKANYHEIISDGHCIKTEDITRDGRLTTPLYVKPHGTNSHKSTLRFTNNHYLELPFDIKEMLKTLFDGILNEKSKKRIEKINLFVVGFAMESFELNNILKSCFETEKSQYTIYDINHEPLSEKPEKFEAFQKTFDVVLTPEGNMPFQEYEFPNTKHRYVPIKTNPEGFDNSKESITSDLAEFFSVIWRKTHDMFTDEFKPRSIAKHEIVNYLLYDDILKNGGNTTDERVKNRQDLKKKYDDFTSPETRDYFLDRAIIEVAIAFTRNKGMVDLVELLKGKPGKYHALYLKSDKKIKEKIDIALPVVSFYDIVSVFAPPPIYGSFLKNTDNIYEIDLEKMDEIFSKENLTNNVLEKINRFEIDLKEFVLQQKLAKYILATLINSSLLSKRTKTHIQKKCYKRVFNGYYTDNSNYNPEKTVLEELYRLFLKSAKSHYYIINPKENDSVHNMFETFSSENLLHTNLSFKLKFKELFEKDWNVAFIVTERGGIFELLKSINEAAPNHFKNKHIILICSYDALKFNDDKQNADEWYGSVKNKINQDVISPQNLTLLFTPSREHNHHIALFLKCPHNSEEKLHQNDVALIDNKLGFNFAPHDAIYHFRQSFSNSIDPLVIKADNSFPKEKVINDFGKMVKLFHLLLLRSFDFTCQINNAKMLEAIGENSLVGEYYKLYKDAKEELKESYKTWKINQYNEQVVGFLKSIYEGINKKSSN